MGLTSKASLDTCQSMKIPHRHHISIFIILILILSTSQFKKEEKSKPLSNYTIQLQKLCKNQNHYETTKAFQYHFIISLFSQTTHPHAFSLSSEIVKYH